MVSLSQAKLRFIFQIPNIWYSMPSPVHEPCYCCKKIRKLLFQAWALHQSSRALILVFPFILFYRMGRVFFQNYCFTYMPMWQTVSFRAKPFVVLSLQDWFSWIQDQNSYIEPWKHTTCFISSRQSTVICSLRVRQVSIVAFN